MLPSAARSVKPCRPRALLCPETRRIGCSPVDARAHSSQEVLATLQALVADDLKRVNQVIIDNMQSEVGLIPQLASHIVSSGGKRLRPLLLLMSARLCGYQGQRHVPLAACVEFIHTATLLHDDVVDESALRRGEATANAVFGNKASVLVGDFLLSRAFQLMTRDGSLEVLQILSDASAVIAEGEVMQLLTSNDLETDEAAYLRVIESKTAKLFEAACRIGPVVADRPRGDVDALARYGMALGVIFQLTDDILDYSAEQAALGKTIGDDFREGKITLPVIVAYERGTEDERRFWSRTMESLEQGDDDLDHAIELMRRHDAFGETLRRAEAYGNAARRALSDFDDGIERRTLDDLISFCIARGF
ncbi:polyprenyl synthetase family protein [Tistrella bauzanensis]|uniref:polyprenyl synthetase family protein n=1 Tax=Tistrella bauzanensis TaxID=657419 RepID=UPI0031FAABA4